MMTRASPVDVMVGLRRDRHGASSPSQLHPMYTTPTKAGILIIAPIVQSSTPTTGRPSRANQSPARRKPSINASLCAPAIRCNSTRGFSTASTKATEGSRPYERASRGTKIPIITTPTSASRRKPTTASSSSWRTTVAFTPAIQRNKGPYGEVTSAQSLSTSPEKAFTPSTAGPNKYGLIPRLIISPWAA